jgi:hypothetical protein
VPTTQEIIDAVAANLAQPRRARTDAGEIEQHELNRQVEAARFVLDAKAAQGNPFAFVRKALIEAPGGIG